MLIDSHTHIDAAEFDGDREEVLARSVEAGVNRWVIPATSPASVKKALSAGWRRDGVFFAAGIHPQEVNQLPAESVDEVEEILRTTPEIVAVGEIGLDYHYGRENRDLQISIFERQVELAKRFDRPVIVHVRESYEDVLEILSAAAVRGVLHSFTGDLATAERALSLGLFLGFNGILTFKASQPLRDLVKAVPLDRILVETDAPYLAPVPKRGRRNEPSFLPAIVSTLEAAHGPETSLWITSNAERLFGLT